jgi:hypothetical protein
MLQIQQSPATPTPDLPRMVKETSGIGRHYGE